MDIFKPGLGLSATGIVSGRPHRAVAGHFRSFNLALRRTFECPLRLDNGYSLDDSAGPVAT